MQRPIVWSKKGEALKRLSVPANLNLIVPQSGLELMQANAGTLRFRMGSGKASAPFTFQAEHYAAVRVQLSDDQIIEPLPLGEVHSVRQQLRSGIDAMALVALQLESVIVTGDGKLMLSLSFLNIGRSNLKVDTPLNGSFARLVDGELKMSAPDAVSPALERSIVPKSGMFLSENTLRWNHQVRHWAPGGSVEMAILLPGIPTRHCELEFGVRAVRDEGS